MFQPIDDYIDYDDPLWAGMKYMADTFFSVGGKHYIFITDVMANSVVVYNRRIMDEWGFDDPAELFYNNEWTWDKMMEMSMDFTTRRMADTPLMHGIPRKLCSPQPALILSNLTLKPASMSQISTIRGSSAHPHGCMTL